jgi:steroid delta-isomerase-like uncharacterized protein
MSKAQMQSVLHRYAEAKNEHDIEAALMCCTDDSIYENVPQGLEVKGKEALAQFYGGFFAAFPDYAGDFDGEAYGDETAVVWGRMSGTSAGEFMGVEAKGQAFDVPVCFVITFSDGLISSDRGFFDLATLCGQLGVPIDAVRAPADVA